MPISSEMAKSKPVHSKINPKRGNLLRGFVEIVDFFNLGVKVSDFLDPDQWKTDKRSMLLILIGLPIGIMMLALVGLAIINL